MKDPYVIQREAMLHLHEMLAEKEDALIELQAECDKREKLFWKVIRELRLLAVNDYQARESIGLLSNYAKYKAGGEHEG